MKFRTLQELGHDTRAVTLIDTASPQAQHGADIILVPHPTNDVNDPLRFPQWKKWTLFTNMLLLTFMCQFWLGGLAPAFLILSEEFHVSVSASTGLLIWPLLAAGLCVSQSVSNTPSAIALTRSSFSQNFWWVPTADYIGRRPVFFFCALVTFVCQIWAGASKTYGSLLAARVIGSFTSSCHEALGGVIVNVRCMNDA